MRWFLVLLLAIASIHSFPTYERAVKRHGSFSPLLRPSYQFSGSGSNAELLEQLYQPYGIQLDRIPSRPSSRLIWLCTKPRELTSPNKLVVRWRFDLDKAVSCNCRVSLEAFSNFRKGSVPANVAVSFPPKRPCGQKMLVSSLISSGDKSHCVLLISAPHSTTHSRYCCRFRLEMWAENRNASRLPLVILPVRAFCSEAREE